MVTTRRADPGVGSTFSGRTLLAASAGAVFGGAFAALSTGFAGGVYLPSVIAGAVLHAAGGAWLGRAFELAKRSAITDPLTGLFNRRYLKRRLSDAMRRRARYGTRGAILALDLDQMKSINDTLGHAGGDRALKLVADAIRESVRATDVSARVGGDEFAVLLLDHSLDQAASVAKRINVSLKQQTKTWSVPVSVSVGVAQIDPSLLKEDELLGAADEALYRAKRAGRDRVVVQADDNKSAPRLTLEEAAMRLGRALGRPGPAMSRDRILS
jgi:diguanylate cyclase (GGDEF)-like protein